MTRSRRFKPSSGSSLSAASGSGTIRRETSLRSIASEAGELLAHYRWGDDPAGSMAEVSEEVADVFLGILRFADVAEIDLVDVSRRKLERNALKYPEGRSDPEPLKMPGSIDR